MSFLSAEQKEEFKDMAKKMCHRVAGKLIAKADSDNDGKLSYEEAAEHFGGSEENKRQFEEVIDKNKDGKVDREELGEFLFNMIFERIVEEGIPKADEMLAHYW